MTSLVFALDYFSAIFLALVQGLTEFLPISSSAHLILIPRFLGWEDQGLAFDVAVHLGTLIAVIWFFHDEIMVILKACLASVTGKDHQRREARLGWDILIASLPLIVCGFFLEGFVETQWRSPLLIAFATAIFGLLLWLADRRRAAGGDEYGIGFSTALLIGIAQVFALIPGTSRSGITITAGLGLGLSRQAAARFSFLLAIPAISGAAYLELLQLFESDTPVLWNMLGLGMLAAAVSAYFCIKLFLNAIDKIGMLPFFIYRLVLAGIIFLVFV